MRFLAGVAVVLLCVLAASPRALAASGCYHIGCNSDPLPQQSLVGANPAGSITDALGNVWTVVGGQIGKNGVIDPATGGVVLLLYYGDIMYQANSQGNWYQFTTNNWPGGGACSNGCGSLQIAGDPRLDPQAGDAITPGGTNPGGGGGGTGCGGGSIPAGAAAAGFTTCAANFDFTSAAYANTATWLDCAGAPRPTWFLNLWWYSTFSNGQGVPCPGIVNDPVAGGNVLDLAWLTSYPTGNGQDSITINTAGPGPNGNQGINFPITGYFESTYRITPTVADSTNYPLSSFWSWGFNTDAAGPIEIDGIETYGSNFGSFDAATHQWASGNNPPGSGYLWQGTGSLPAGYDPTQYNTYGWRVTSDGSGNMQVCAYVNNVFIGCRSPAPTAAQFNQRQFDILGNGGFNTQLSANTHMYVKNVHNYECTGWATGPCNGTVLSGPP